MLLRKKSHELRDLIVTQWTSQSFLGTRLLIGFPSSLSLYSPSNQTAGRRRAVEAAPGKVSDKIGSKPDEDSVSRKLGQNFHKRKKLHDETDCTTGQERV